MSNVKFTNKLNLPEPLVNALQYDSHRMMGHISVTQLIEPPRIRVLKKFIEKEEDVTDRMWMLWGSAIHNILEKSNMSGKNKDAIRTVANLFKSKSQSPDDTYDRVANYLKSEEEKLVFDPNERYIIEKTFVAPIEGWDLCGTVDLYDKERQIIQDWKLCKTYKWTSAESRKQWIKQLNVYAWLLEKNGFPVKGLQIVPFFRDWTALTHKYKSQRGQDYPDTEVSIIDIPMKPLDQIEAYIKVCIKDHQMAEEGNVRDCTGEERWAEADVYAVMVEGGTRAKHKFSTKEEAHNYIEEFGYKFANPLYAQHRPGKSKRCEEYCPVFELCPQIKNIVPTKID